MLRGMPWSLRAKALDFFDGENTRRSALSHPMVAEMTRRSNAEDIMTVKLFKLMYETVKECDAKVGKAEKLRKIYNKSKPFEVGYMFGDITDKYSTMQDIAKTLRRMYNQWQPIEHVNAYEQIASQGIELNHLVDILKSASSVKISVCRLAYDAYYVAYYGNSYTKRLSYPSGRVRPHMSADRFVKDQREDLLNLMADMMKEAMRTRTKMEKVRRVHHKQLPYQIGFILGIIRETYARMMTMYRQARNRFLNRDPYLLPTMFFGDFVNLEFFMIMEDIHYGEIKINRLVDLIEKTSLSNFNVTYSLRRARQQEEAAEDLLRRMEQMEVAYKREVRRQYRMHRLGLPINATTTLRGRMAVRRRHHQRHQAAAEDTWADYDGGLPNRRKL